MQVEASSPAELAAHLARELHTDPQDSRAAAHLLHACRAAITAPKWSARRLGVLAFVPDAPADQERATERHQNQEAEPSHQDAQRAEQNAAPRQTNH